MKKGYKNKAIKPEGNKNEFGYRTKRVAKYIGGTEIYFPKLKKIVKDGELVPEISIKEAESRSDFTVVETID